MGISRGYSALWMLWLPLACVPHAGCARSHATRIAFIPRTTGTQLWEAEHAGAAAAASQWNVNLYWNAPTREDDVERQIAMVESVIDKGYDAIVLSPDQPLPLLSSVNRALARGMRVVIVGSPMPLAPHPALKLIVNDDEETGRLAATRIADRLQGRGDVAVLGVDSDLGSIVRREHAFRLQLAEHSPNIHIVEEKAGAFNRAQTEKTTSDIFRTHPGVRAIFALTLEATQGADAAVLHESRNVVLVGCEQDLGISVRSAEMDSVVIENTFAMGFDAVRWIMHAQPAGNDEVLVKPLLVTKENLDRDDVRQMLSLFRKQE